MPRDRVTANLPSRDLAATRAFYEALGFTAGYAGETWMILARGPFEIEFFHHPDLDPRSSWFSACIRTSDIVALHADFARVGLSTDPGDIPRLTAPEPARGDVPPMFALIDADGSLLRCFGESAG